MIAFSVQLHCDSTRLIHSVCFNEVKFSRIKMVENGTLQRSSAVGKEHSLNNNSLVSRVVGKSTKLRRNYDQVNAENAIENKRVFGLLHKSS